MAIYYNLPIYKVAYNLLLSIARTMPDMPRDCRYGIGQDLRRKVMDIIIGIYNANRVTEKVSIIRCMREALLESQVYARIMGDLHYISDGRHSEWMEMMVSLSKQMSAWEKSQNEKRGQRMQ